MKQIEFMTFALNVNADTKRYFLELRNLQRCENKNIVIYYVDTDKIKHDVKENITLEEIINLYE
jgi:hypothetical protein